MTAGEDVDVCYVWHEAPVPPRFEITQVYGYLFCPRTARVLVLDDDGKFNLPGGTPEPFDEDLTATLAREAAEEGQVRFDGAVYLGFQEVRRPGRAPYAQVRMAGRIAGFDPRRPDPDNGRMYRRLMCPLRDVPGVLGWGGCGGGAGERGGAWRGANVAVGHDGMRRRQLCRLIATGPTRRRSGRVSLWRSPRTSGSAKAAADGGVLDPPALTNQHRESVTIHNWRHWSKIMRLRLVGKDPESNPTGSPTIYRTDRDTWVVQGWSVTDPEALGQMDLPEGETAVEIPDRVAAFFRQEGREADHG